MRVIRYAGNSNLSLTPSSQLTFTPNLAFAPQYFTFEFREDDDDLDANWEFHIQTKGGDYGTIFDYNYRGRFRFTEKDNDSPALVVDPAGPLNVNEGAAKTYTVKLATKPAQTITVNVETDGDGSVSASPAGLAFTTANWSTPQTVTVTAADDADAEAGTAVVTNVGANANYLNVKASVAITEVDDDSRAITISPASLSVSEGSSVVYGVALETQPTAPVTVEVTSFEGASKIARLDTASRRGRQSKYAYLRHVRLFGGAFGDPVGSAGYRY